MNFNERFLINQAIETIRLWPNTGSRKIEDLTGIYVHNIHAVGRTILIAYVFLSEDWIQLVKVGPHENFYRDLKREN
jgi:hypothetical protein